MAAPTTGPRHSPRHFLLSSLRWGLGLLPATYHLIHRQLHSFIQPAWYLGDAHLPYSVLCNYYLLIGF